MTALGYIVMGPQMNRLKWQHRTLAHSRMQHSDVDRDALQSKICAAMQADQSTVGRKQHSSDGRLNMHVQKSRFRCLSSFFIEITFAACCSSLCSVSSHAYQQLSVLGLRKVLSQLGISRMVPTETRQHRA